MTTETVSDEELAAWLVEEADDWDRHGVNAIPGSPASKVLTRYSARLRLAATRLTACPATTTRTATISGVERTDELPCTLTKGHDGMHRADDPHLPFTVTVGWSDGPEEPGVDPHVLLRIPLEACDDEKAECPRPGDCFGFTVDGVTTYRWSAALIENTVRTALSAAHIAPDDVTIVP